MKIEGGSLTSVRFLDAEQGLLNNQPRAEIHRDFSKMYQLGEHDRLMGVYGTRYPNGRLKSLGFVAYCLELI